ncbi:hypothetical protein HS088_TW01G00704 [Tripterygium wilfordii]|uniref:GDSL esterase/lipase n=1 Tax=Tripterygium wilfordii TaxID=458696 RepID=A0A7J7E3A8_TRIWF|nr:hypothetical protein HS088_TW01G00704 [Tripterygium wilfordii]
MLIESFTITAELLGFDEYIASFKTVEGSQILQGVNYGSGSAGIRDETGDMLGAQISLNEQLQNHQITISKMVNLLGNQRQAAEHLNKCLYSVGMGTNDYTNNYFVPQYYSTSTQYTPQQFADVLTQQYSQQLRTLYNHGARKVALFGLGYIGCTPRATKTYGTINGSSCVDRLNDAALLFNDKLKSLVDQLNSDLTDARFLYINSMDISSRTMNSFPGSNRTTITCCQVNKSGLCDPFKTPCPDRNSYLFWDAFHNTEASNVITARESYTQIKSIV